MSDTNVKFDIRFNTNANNVFNGVNLNIDKTTTALSGFKKGIEKVGESFNRFASLQFKINQIREGFGGFKDSFDKLMAPTVAYNQALMQLKATTGLSASAVDDLGRYAKSTSDSLGMSSAEMLTGMEKIANGIEISQIGGVAGLKKLSVEIATFALASDVDFATASKAVISAKGQFGLGANEMGRAMNVMAAASQKGSAEIPELMESFKLAGTIAGDSGVSIEETSAAFEKLASVGTKGAEAGTQMRNIMLGLRDAGFDLSKGGLTKALKSLNGDLDNLPRLAKIAGKDGIAGLKVLIKEADGIEKLSKEITGTNAASQIAAEKMESFAFKMKKAGQAMTNFLTDTSGFAGTLATPMTVLATFGSSLMAIGTIGRTVWASLGILKDGINLMTVANAKSVWMSTKATIAKSREFIATKWMAIGNAWASVSAGVLAMSNWTVVGSLVAIRTAIFNIPIVGWILAAIAAIITLAATWDEFRYFLLGVWEVIKGILSALWSIATLDFSAAWDSLSNLGTAFKTGYNEAEASDKAEKEKEAKQEKMIEDIEKMAANIEVSAGGDVGSGGVTTGVDTGMVPAMPTFDSPNIGTSAMGGGSLVTAQPTQTTSNSQNVTIQAVNITVTTPRELVDQVKAEVIKALTMAISPTVGAAYNIQ